MSDIELPDEVRVVEVGPRDGLQNERARLSVEQKLRLIEGLVDAGLRDVEAGSFVHPRWIPQMADTGEVFRRLQRRPDVRYWALVPNMKGLENALAAGVEHVAVFLSSSETHNRKNINRTIDESLQNVREVTEAARQEGCEVRGYVSTVFGCPYEGDVDFDRVMEITESLLSFGVGQVSLGDTTGMGLPTQVGDSLQRAVERFGSGPLALHLHDTRGLGLANALMGLHAGMRTFDSSIGGMGGCPYAPGASGNLGTEDLVHMLHGSGIKTGIDLERLLGLSRLLENDFGATLNSRYYRYSQADTRQSKAT